MLRFLIPLVLCISILPAFSQIPLIDSDEVIKNGRILNDSGKFAEAIKMYNRVPARDTNYVYMLTQLAVAYVANNEFDKGQEQVEQILKKPSKYRAQMLHLQALIVERKGNFDKAITLFEGALKEFPTSFSLRYGMGLAYYSNKHYEKAVECFFSVLKLNPFHPGSHLHLALISMAQGRRVHAMFSMGTYLGINYQDNKRLVLLHNFLDNQLAETDTVPMFGSNASDKLDQIIRSKIAMDKKFKSEIPIEAAVVKQFELFFDQLNTLKPTPADPWMNFYFPIYKSMKDQAATQPFIYHLLFSSANEVSKKWRTKNEKELKGYYLLVNTELKKIRETLSMPALGFANEVKGWYDGKGNLEAIGNASGDGTRTDRWIYFNPNSQKSAEGSFDQKGVKIEVWKFYRDDGTVKSIEDYRTGEVTVYSSEGFKQEHFFLKNDEIHGNIELYHPCGLLKEKSTYENGKRQGKGELYHPSGKIDLTYQYLDNKRTGEFVGYFENGIVSARVNYSDNLLNGKGISFYINGKKKSEGQYVNGEQTGLWTFYYASGKVEQSGTYSAAGLAVGTWNYYDEQGLISETRIFDEAGRLHGDNPNYKEGKLHYVLTYKKDVLIKSVFYKDEKEISKNGNGDGSFLAKNYYSTGQLFSEGAYKKGVVEGLWKFYYRSGKLKSDYTYVDGLVEGEAHEFYPSGEKKTVQAFKNDENHGYYQSFYRNGKVKEEGWFQNGNREQQWLTYMVDGSLESDYYYLSGRITGPAYDYALDKRIYNIENYNENGITHVANYNSKGNLINAVQSKKDSIVREERFANTKLRFQYSLRCGTFTGEMKKWYPDGTLFYMYNFVQGKKHGPYEARQINGELKSLGQFVGGLREGLWKEFYEDGRLRYEGNYRNGSSDSLWTFYYADGKISSVVNYRDDERHGVSRLFSPEGVPIVEKLYDKGDILSYRTLNADGTGGQWIQFPGTGTITVKYANGNLALDEQYKDRLRHGNSRIYYQDGELYSEFKYDMGDFEGDFVQNYATGKAREKGTYKEDELDGKSELYDLDGTLLKVENYRMGTRYGKTLIYKKGVIQKEVDFWNGEAEE
jgi:antitoxin component YwqK of YwqJK toxin-antitoxin module